MATIELKGCIWGKKEVWESDIQFTFFEGTGSTYLAGQGYFKICDHTIQCEMPDDFNPIAAEVAALNAKKEAVQREFTERIREINDRISNLLCLEFNPTPEPNVNPDPINYDEISF